MTARRRHLPSRLRTALTVLLSCTLLAAGLTVASTAAAAPGAVLVAQVAPYQVLVFSKTAGFRHDSIPAGIAAIQQLGAANGFTVVATEDAAAFTDANLANFATVVFLSTTGDVLNATQQAAFERYIRAGGGYVGVHAAADTEYDWAWYGGLVGAYFNQHPAIQPATVKVEDPAHPSTAGLPALWSRTDEWYNFRTNPRGAVHVLASLDEKTYAPGTGAMGADHPITWCQDYDGGRSWYTGLGHDSATFTDAALPHACCSAASQSTAGAVAGRLRRRPSRPLREGHAGQQHQQPDGARHRPGRPGVLHRARRAGADHQADHRHHGHRDRPRRVHRQRGRPARPAAGPRTSPPTAGSTSTTRRTAGAARNQISRFTVAGDTIALTTERVVLQVPTQRNTCCHQGGSMTFDSAGNLYLATGDNTNPFESDGFTPIDERAGRQDYDAQRTSGNTNDLRGKIVRIKPQADGTYTVPAGNLFAAGHGQHQARDLRDGLPQPVPDRRGPADQHAATSPTTAPTRGATNPNRGPEGTVEWNIVTTGQLRLAVLHRRELRLQRLDLPVRPVRREVQLRGAGQQLAQQHRPAEPAGRRSAATVDYDYGGNPLFPEIGGGGAPMGGPVYRYNAALGLRPQVAGLLRRQGASSASGTRTSSTRSRSARTASRWWTSTSCSPSMTFKRPMDMEFGPDGALYLIEWGTGFGGNNDDSGIYRIDYISGGRAPIAVASGTPTTGPVPLTVQFSSAGSRDPDGQAITYAWTFGDGGTSTAANPSHTYTTGRQLQRPARRDRHRGPQRRWPTCRSRVGNTAPTVTMTVAAGRRLLQLGRHDPLHGDGDRPRGRHHQLRPGDRELLPRPRRARAHACSPTPAARARSRPHRTPGTARTRTSSACIEADLHRQRRYGRHRPADRPVTSSCCSPSTSRPSTSARPAAHRAASAAATPAWSRETTARHRRRVPEHRLHRGRRLLVDVAGQPDQHHRGRLPGRLARRRRAHRGPHRRGERTAGRHRHRPGHAGGWQTYTDITATISGQSGGSGPLFFVAKNPVGDTGQGSLFNVNWMDFAGPGIADTSQLTVSPGSLAFGSVAVGSTSAACRR